MRLLACAVLLCPVVAFGGTDDDEFEDEPTEVEVSSPTVLKAAKTWRASKLRGYKSIASFCEKERRKTVREWRRHNDGKPPRTLGCEGNLVRQPLPKSAPFTAYAWINVNVDHPDETLDVYLALELNKRWYIKSSFDSGEIRFWPVSPGSDKQMMTVEVHHDYDICGGCDSSYRRFVFVCGVGSSKRPSCTESTPIESELEGWKLRWGFDKRGQMVFTGTIDVQDRGEERWAHWLLKQPHKLVFP